MSDMPVREIDDTIMYVCKFMNEQNVSELTFKKNDEGKITVALTIHHPLNFEPATDKTIKGGANE
jgi:hypothetical protein